MDNEVLVNPHMAQVLLVILRFVCWCDDELFSKLRKFTVLRHRLCIVPILSMSYHIFLYLKEIRKKKNVSRS